MLQQNIDCRDSGNLKQGKNDKIVERNKYRMSSFTHLFDLVLNQYSPVLTLTVFVLAHYEPVKRKRNSINTTLLNQNNYLNRSCN